ncbi:MAG: DUF5107 domain-containing protein, partial [Anaerolineae bacterium]|nr:DUF5107 domain-containing protein [Anaerolineae bacterium]
PADKAPMFLDKRVNQGTSGRVYPVPFTDKLSSESEPRDYTAVYLENDYIRLMMLPQIGGRIHEALDKTNGYHFIYRQHVVKPALIGLFGAWMSGGIECNWPQHHRPSTYMPTHHLIEENADGSVTVWMSENDPLQRMKGMVGICLYPGKAFFEMKVQLYNRTPEVQTFLWWLNAGVHVHDKYQVVFPPDVTVVTDHSKRSMSHYPIAKGTYYGMDFSNEGQGTDISWYSAIPVPTSYFVWESDEDYFGGYDHKAGAGIIHVANHHIAPGKKMFTWGAGEFAKGWEANLTDEDGPYIELMAGAYTDNQPDFSWLQPYETKTFSQFWYPVQKIGPAKQANRRAAVNLEIANCELRIANCEGNRRLYQMAKIGVAVTETLAGAMVALLAKGDVVVEAVVDLAPDTPYVNEVALPEGVVETDLLLRVCDSSGCELIRYAPREIEVPPLPEVKTPPLPPDTFETIEELYLTGLHLEQYRHPTIEPEPYWEEALRRDPGDARCNNALGLVQFRRGNFGEAIAHFRVAVDRLTRRNPNPQDNEVYYNLGRALKYTGDLDAAYAAFYKAIWDYAQQGASYYALAEIDALRGDFAAALEHLDRALQVNTRNTKARNFKAAVLRKLGHLDEAASLVRGTLEMDPLDMWARNEGVLISLARGSLTARGELEGLTQLMHVSDPLSEIQSYFDIAFDYANAGFWKEAADMLTRLTQNAATTSPMVLYALGYFAYRQGQEAEMQLLYRRASETPLDYCFPVLLEEMVILQHAQSLRPEDAQIAYHLGNLYYDKKRYPEAVHNWRLATQSDQSFAAIAWRNLGIAHYNIHHDAEEAIACYETAFKLNSQDGRILSELSQLRARTGAPAVERLALLERHLDLVRDRDDLSVELATLYNRTGKPQKALDYVLSRRFHPWEGGTGSVSKQYVLAHRLLGQAALEGGDAKTALAHFTTAMDTYPANLGERNWPDMNLHYYVGLAKQSLGDADGAQASFDVILAVDGGLSESGYYQGLALKALGRAEEARVHYQDMLDKATAQLDAQAKQGFATSVPEFIFTEVNRETRHRIHLTYIIGLAHLGLGHIEEAESALKQVLALEPNHFGAQEALKSVSLI